MTEEQLKEQIELDRMIAQAEIDRDPIIQDERVQLSAPPEGTGDNVYEGANAIDPREVGVDALNAGALSDEDFMMAEEFMNALPPEERPSFMELLMAKPREAMNAVMDTLGQMFGREEEAITGENFISYDSEGNATIGGSTEPYRITGNEFRGTPLYSKFYPSPSSPRDADEMRRRIDMDIGQPVVARSGMDVNSPELDALLDRGAVERARFQSQDRTAEMIGREELKKRIMDSYYDENRPPNFGRLESDARMGVLNKLDR